MPLFRSTASAMGPPEGSTGFYHIGSEWKVGELSGDNLWGKGQTPLPSCTGAPSCSELLYGGERYFGRGYLPQRYLP